MGNVVRLYAARMARAEQRQREVHAEISAAIARGEGCPWSREEMVEGWCTYVRQSWRPVRAKRGSVKRVMREAYEKSDQGTDWLSVCPLDLILIALPARFDEEQLEAATYLTMLLFDYLWRIAAISDDDKRFAFEWSRKAQAHVLTTSRG